MELKSLQYQSKRNILERFGTISLNKLEAMYIEGELDKRDKDVLSAFIFYNFKDSLNKYRHPKLYEELKLFEKSLENKKQTDTRYQLNKELISRINKSKERNESKDEFRIWAIEKLNEKKLSLNFVSQKVDIKYSNFYNFLKKRDNTKLSSEGMNRLREYLTEEDI